MPTSASTGRRRAINVLLGILMMVATTTHAFAPSSLQHHHSHHRRLSTTRSTKQFLVPESADTLHHFVNSLSSVGDHAHIMASTSQWLADAAAGVAENEPGWWDNYLNIFKNALSLVHSVIDPPLRSIGVTQTWGFSIFIFTLLCRSLLIPLSIQQSKSAEYMKALKPYTAKIREKYKNNPDAQNRALGKLYEDAEQNPLAGCLTSLAQLPIFLGLYRGVRLLAVDGELEEPFFWIPSLEGPVSAPDYRGLDWITQGWMKPDGGGLPIPQLGWETTLAFLAMPAILVFMQSLTMSVLAPPIDDKMSDEEKESMENSQRILKFLPLMIGFFSIQVPAGLTIYWFASNLFTLSQSLLVRAYYAANPPAIELPEYWDALEKKNYQDMTPEERRRAVESGISIGPTFADLVDEARFHAFIERPPIRKESDAWRVVMAAEQVRIPSEMQEWVGNSSRIIRRDDHVTESSSSAASPTPKEAAVETGSTL